MPRMRDNAEQKNALLEVSEVYDLVCRAKKGEYKKDNSNERGRSRSGSGKKDHKNYDSGYSRHDDSPNSHKRHQDDHNNEYKGEMRERKHNNDRKHHRSPRSSSSRGSRSSRGRKSSERGGHPGGKYSSTND